MSQNTGNFISFWVISVNCRNGIEVERVSACLIGGIITAEARREHRARGHVSGTL